MKTTAEMIKTRKRRKRRSDRRHLLYVLTNRVTEEKYIGIAACIDRSGKETLAARWCRHVGRALRQNKTWKLSESIRIHGPDAFDKSILQIVRGKQIAFDIETQLRKSGQFKLNTV